MTPFADPFPECRATFLRFRESLRRHGLELDPDTDLRRASGLLCRYSLADRQIHLSIPEWSPTHATLFVMVLGSMLSAESEADLARFLRLFLPRIVAHEIGHALRHRQGMFDASNLWREEQDANQLAAALCHPLYSPDDRRFLVRFIDTAIAELRTRVKDPGAAQDSYGNLLQSLYAQGQIGTETMETIEAIGNLMSTGPELMLEDADLLASDVRERLRGRDGLIQSFNADYADDQTLYMYYQLGWLRLDLLSRENHYIDEFARERLGRVPSMLPVTRRDQIGLHKEVRACYAAYQRCRPLDRTASRYFYKRYRSEFLDVLRHCRMTVPLNAERLRRETEYLMEQWREEETDALELLATFIDEGTRELLPNRIGRGGDLPLDPESGLISDADRRMLLHVLGTRPDAGAAETLRRLLTLDGTDVFGDLPAEAAIDICVAMFELRVEPGETIIWQGESNDDVFLPIDGSLEYRVVRADAPPRTGPIPAGSVFGEMAFITDDPRAATVVALTEARILMLKSADLKLLCHRHPSILRGIASVIARRLQAAQLGE